MAAQQTREELTRLARLARRLPNSDAARLAYELSALADAATFDRLFGGLADALDTRDDVAAERALDALTGVTR